ncbi:MAG: cob(I)yrinic acid a,c-diamide adenosyltransferase [Planctomycetota bacterium]
MSITTGKGDKGRSGLIDGTRIPKDDARLEAYGTVDELNATLGWLRSQDPPATVDAELEQIIAWLFAMGSDLATPPAKQKEANTPPYLPEAASKTLTEWIHREEAALPKLRSFILPGGTPAAAAAHVARTVCRRAERRVVTLQQRDGDPRTATAVIFLNRLSDLLFVYSRRCNHDAGVPDVEWKSE